MTEIQKKRSIAAYKANMTRKLAKLSPKAHKARKAIVSEYEAKIAAVESINSSADKSVKMSCSCKKSHKCSKETKEQVYEVYTRNHGRFVFVGKTTKNPLA